MTDAELDHLERIFRNPPSASGLADYGLALIAELRRMRDPVPQVAAVPAPLPEPEPISKVIAEQHFGGAEGSKPTPPARPIKKGK